MDERVFAVGETECAQQLIGAGVGFAGGQAVDAAREIQVFADRQGVK